MKKSNVALALFSVLLNGALAGLVVDTTAPAGGDTISAQTQKANYTKIFDYDANNSHGRGMLFTTPDNSGIQWGTTGITLIKDTAQTYNNDSITLYVFSGVADSTAWVLGDGDSDGDLFDGTGASILATQSFTLSGAIADESYLHFNLDAPVLMDDNTTYGFLFKYTQGSGPDNMRIHQQNTWTGDGTQVQQIQMEGAANAIATTSLSYYVSIPEPATMGMVALFGGGILFIRRRLML